MQKKIRLIIIIQIIILMTCSIAIIKLDSKDSNVDVKVQQWTSPYINYENGAWHVDENSGIDERVDLLRGPGIYLEKGDYVVTVWYECDNRQSFQPHAEGINDNYIKADSAKLDSNLSMSSYRFRVKEDVDNFEILFRYNGKGSFSVFNINIEKVDNSGRILTYLFLLCLLIDCTFFYFKLPYQKREEILAVLGITILISLPLFYKGLNGHDLIFHLMRIEGITKELRLGNFPVRISSAWMGEYGYPTSIFYGDILLYFPAVLRILGFTINEAYKIFVFLINLATTVIANACFGKIFKNKKIAFILTIAYSTSTYRIVNMYVRAAVGEFTAQLFIPVIAYAVYQIYTNNDSIKKNVVNGTILAMGMTGVIQTHILSAELVVFVLMIVCLSYIKRTLSLHVIRSFLIAIVQTVLLCMGFLIPFLDYFLTVSVNITSRVSRGKNAIQGDGVNLAEFFAFFSNPFGSATEMLLTPGVFLIITLGVAIILWKRKQATKEMKTLTVLAVLTLFISTNLFPWNNLAHDISFFAILAQVQFPYRFIGIATIFITLLQGFILLRMEYEQNIQFSLERIKKISIGIGIVMMSLFISHYADNAERNIYYDTLNIDTYGVVGAEYLRADTQLDELTGKIESKGTESVRMLSRKGCEMDISCVTGENIGYVILPVINYKGYVVTDDTGNQYEIVDDQNDMVSFYVPEKFDGILQLRFKEPWYWSVAWGISLVTAITICSVWLIKKKTEK